jgi:diguanylate cyclase (GGDEF)-like protein
MTRLGTPSISLRRIACRTSKISPTSGRAPPVLPHAVSRKTSNRKFEPGPNSIVQLDVPTLMMMGSFASACAGVVLLIAWWQNRNVPALGLWGLGNFVDTAGIFCLLVGPVLHRPVLIMVADALVALGPGLIWKAARSLDRKPAPWGIAVFGGAVAGLASASAATRAAIDMLSFASAALYLFAAAYSLWVSRAERLAARWPLIILTALHAVVLLAGALGYSSGAIVDDAIPTALSLFGLINFESMLFLLGTAAFLLAFVKEREEVTSRIAASTDPLTGIANRGGFMLRADRVVERCRRDGSPVSVLMFDLDRFKEINDTFGHAVGDATLLKFCKIASSALRPNDVFGRIGGDEFAVVLPGSGIEAAWVRAERIRTSFMQMCRKLGEFEVHATASGGVATSTVSHQSLDTLLAAADIALYNAKIEGRNLIKRSNDPKPDDDGEPDVIRVG